MRIFSLSPILRYQTPPSSWGQFHIQQKRVLKNLGFIGVPPTGRVTHPDYQFLFDYNTLVPSDFLLTDSLRWALSSFDGGWHSIIKLEKSLVVYRAGLRNQGANCSNHLGSWFTLACPPQNGILDIYHALAIHPFWYRDNRCVGCSPIDTIHELELPAGLTLVIGPVSSQRGFAAGDFGIVQVYVSTDQIKLRKVDIKHLNQVSTTSVYQIRK